MWQLSVSEAQNDGSTGKAKMRKSVSMCEAWAYLSVLSHRAFSREREMFRCDVRCGMSEYVSSDVCGRDVKQGVSRRCILERVQTL